MRLDFLTPRIDRLSADGGLEAVYAGAPLGRLFRRPVVLLARELCAFGLFETANLPRGRRRQAARLHARTASPYVAGGAALVKSGEDFGVWWWDLARVAPMIAGRGQVSLRPETLAQPVGRDWRIVKLARGYEAQHWRDGGLRASAWRAARYDDAAWTAFARTQRDARVEAPATPPPAESLPVDRGGEAFSLARAEITREQAIGLGLGGLALASASLFALILGQSIQTDNKAAEIEGEIAEIQAATPRQADTQALEGERRRLASFREIENRTSPLSAAGAAIGILAIHDLTPIALDAQAETLTLTLPYEAVKVAGDLVAEFEGSGYFHQVEPRTDAAGQRLIIEMQVREAAPPLSPDA
ncbi:MAG TPA: hypothetical protein PLQ03_03645 [Brevundimonas sp.]|uniref:hypothetical protein n=1 Tax=Brevundimonas sp. TaxID=1871086 RepID=UPI00262653B4|nr:hypothetical protein [Brevundimonas sp.]HRO32484.1 hypothetical protein [Brevundimonas sp.]